jgi:hypothetical protein
MLVVLPREARDAAALALTADRPRLDRLAPPEGPTTAGQGPATADYPPGQREPSLGLPAHQRRTTAPRRPGVGHDPHHHASSRVGSCASAGGYDLAGVPAPAGHRDHGLRLLHRRHDLAAAAVGAVLHRAGHSASPPRRRDRPPRWPLGCPAGPQPAADVRGSRTSAAVSGTPRVSVGWMAGGAGVVGLMGKESRLPRAQLQDAHAPSV